MNKLHVSFKILLEFFSTFRLYSLFPGNLWLTIVQGCTNYTNIQLMVQGKYLITTIIRSK